MALFHNRIFQRISLLKENFSMWVTSGSCVSHIWIAVWISKSHGLTGVIHFQPCWNIYNILKESIANPIISMFYNPNTGELYLSDSLLHNLFHSPSQQVLEIYIWFSYILMFWAYNFWLMSLTEHNDKFLYKLWYNLGLKNCGENSLE